MKNSDLHSTPAIGRNQNDDRRSANGFERAKARLLHRIASQHVTGQTLQSTTLILGKAESENAGIILSPWDDGGFSLPNYFDQNEGLDSSLTTSYFSSPEAEQSHPSRILSEFHKSLELLGKTSPRNRKTNTPSPILSIKPDALDFSTQQLDGLLQVATPMGIRIHIDSLSPESVPKVFEMVDKLPDGLPRTLPNGLPALGATVPSRWTRSESDLIEWMNRGLAIRIVKGQWPDPSEKTDARKRFLHLALSAVERFQRNLAGNAPQQRLPGDGVGRVISEPANWKLATSKSTTYKPAREPILGLATHDRTLLKKIVQQLSPNQRMYSSTAPFAIEQFFSLPLNSLQLARENHLPYRLYIAYGHPALPYNTRFAFTRPGIALWVASSLFRPSLRSK